MLLFDELRIDFKLTKYVVMWIKLIAYSDSMRKNHMMLLYSGIVKYGDKNMPSDTMKITWAIVEHANNVVV